MYSKLTLDQVNSLHMLFKFLRKLETIGIIETDVATVPLTDFGRPFRYSVKIIAYYPGQYQSDQDKLDELINQICS